MRLVSLFLAGASSIIGLVFPFLLAVRATGQNQTIFLVMMIGVSGAFIYGVGFQPSGKYSRMSISPSVTWPVILVSLGILIGIR